MYYYIIVVLLLQLIYNIYVIIINTVFIFLHIYCYDNYYEYWMYISIIIFSFDYVLDFLYDIFTILPFTIDTTHIRSIAILNILYPQTECLCGLCFIYFIFPVFQYYSAVLLLRP